MSFLRFKDWVEKGYVQVRRVVGKGHLVIWVDADERERLGRLRNYHWPCRLNRYPAELTRSEVRSDQKRGRGAQTSRDENDDKFDRSEPADPGDGATEQTAVIDLKRCGLPGGPPFPSGSRHDHAASGVVRRTERRGIFWGRLSPKSQTSDDRHAARLPSVRCVKGEYVPRINGILYVE